MSAGKRFEAYTERLALALGHEDRDGPFRQYTTGLLLPLTRKSVEPIAAGIDPTQVSATHQSLHHFVAKSDWSDRALLAAIRRQVLPQIERHGPIEAWIVDDTGFPKKGKHSVGVARQYCGQLGKQDNCQAAVSLSVANEAASLPIDYQLYLPKDWAGDAARRAKAGVPEEIGFQTKPCIALDQIRRAIFEGVPKGVVLGDAGYGDMKFQAALLELGLDYVLGIKSTVTVWADKTPLPVSVKDWARSLPASAWQEVAWREGVKGDLASRFAARRVHPVHLEGQREEFWLIAEWPAKETMPTKYWLANLPADTTIERLVYLAKLRWRIERDYQELKQEIGLGHYEGRGWRGFHHHASLCIAAYGFLVAERLTFPPQRTGTKSRFKLSAQAKAIRPRGSPDPARTAQRAFHRNPTHAHRRRTHP